MSLVLLDSTPVGLLVHRRRDLRRSAEDWLSELMAVHSPMLPEIVWFEIRRELLRISAAESVARLDGLRTQIPYVHVTSAVLTRASELWASARRLGRPSADDKALDIDVILAATALEVAAQTPDVIVATSNVGHLAQFVDARPWRTIAP